MIPPRLPTKAEYDAATPFAKGYWAYTFSHWPGSEIPDTDKCPFPAGTDDHDQFQRGVQRAVLAAQDSES
jgi:hypothetical protein